MPTILEQQTFDIGQQQMDARCSSSNTWLWQHKQSTRQEDTKLMNIYF